MPGPAISKQLHRNMIRKSRSVKFLDDPIIPHTAASRPCPFSSSRACFKAIRDMQRGRARHETGMQLDSMVDDRATFDCRAHLSPTFTPPAKVSEADRRVFLDTIEGRAAPDHRGVNVAGSSPRLVNQTRRDSRTNASGVSAKCSVTIHTTKPSRPLAVKVGDRPERCRGSRNEPDRGFRGRTQSKRRTNPLSRLSTSPQKPRGRSRTSKAPSEPICPFCSSQREGRRTGEFRYRFGDARVSQFVEYSGLPRSTRTPLRVVC